MNDDEKDMSFSLSSKSGNILPGASETITVTYTPSMPGSATCTKYNISILGGNNLNLSCMGQSLVNDVCLSSKSIHFGEVQLESTTNRLLNVVNDSDQPTTFQFYSDKTNIFAFSKTEGIIKPHSTARIIIEFYP